MYKANDALVVHAGCQTGFEARVTELYFILLVSQSKLQKTESDRVKQSQAGRQVGKLAEKGVLVCTQTSDLGDLQSSLLLCRHCHVTKLTHLARSFSTGSL